MIIACEKCSTRFKVGDDKFAAGPIRVRCSKCNHVFLAAGPPPTAAPVATSAPAPGPITGMFSIPNIPAPSVPPTRSGIFRPPTGSMPGVTAPNALATTMSQPPTTSQLPSTAQNPMFQAPSSSLPPTTVQSNLLSQPMSGSLPPTQVVGRPPPDDPFRGLDPFGRRPTPGQQPGPPPGAVPDPFAPRGTPLPRTSSDPFNPGATAAATPRALGASDPFGFGAAPRSDPFAGLGGGAAPSSPPTSFPPPDPFAGMTSPSPSPSLSSPPARTPTSSDPFAGFGIGGGSAPPIADPFRPPSQATSLPPGTTPFPDPFTSTEAFNPQELMGTSSPPSLSSSSPGLRPTVDPFAAVGAPSPSGGAIGIDGDIDASDLSVESVPAPAVSRVPPPSPSEDPFGGLDSEIGEPSGMFDTGAVDDGPGMVAAPGSISKPRASEPAATPAPARADAKPFAVNAPTTGADMTKLRRLEAAQRVKELAWAAGQGLLLLLFLVVAVVLGRGGRIDDLLHGDVRAALGGARVAGGLGVEEAHVARRTLPSGIDVVVITGVVVNTTSAALPAARVDVRFGEGPWFSGWAWSSIDGVDVDRVVDAPDTAPLSMRSPTSANLQPGDRAPFVIVAPAPQEGLKARFAVTAAKQ